MPGRFPTPFDYNSKAVIEAVVQPIYHMMTFNATTPATLRFFQATGGANEIVAYPGLLNGGQLANPKIFVVYGYRMHETEDVPNDALVADLKALRYNSWCKFFVGVKEYLTCPMFMVPSGFGIFSSGADASGVTTNTTGAAGWPTFFNRMSIEKRKITLPPQQGFYWDLTPIGITAGQLHQNRNIWTILDGEFGREVM
ncbi:MAG: hypothetical protein KKD44_29445 [Proteobacteria bacterium]|nr:hypothetical protein [Pseudomonadota bacterium]